MGDPEKSSKPPSTATLPGLDSVVARFKDAWRQGPRPALEAFLPEGAGRGQALVELVLVDLEFRLKAGEPARVEDYLGRFPELADNPTPVMDLLAAEYEQRRRREPDLDLEEYLRRFPQYLQELPARLGAAAQNSQTTPPVGAAGDPKSYPSTRDSDPGTAAPSSAEWPTIAGYEILEVLGRGGMGVVYKARQINLKRVIAVKMIRDGALAGVEQVARFRAEAEAVARLQHPNIVQIHEIGEYQGRPFFSLEFVDGGNLAQKMAKALLPDHQAAELVETLARAIHVAHQRCIIHRDLKPLNVLLTTANVPKITDFGLAKMLGPEPGPTASGAIMGTPSYMAPEQAGGHTKMQGPAVDIYALGAILYELLTGRPPFLGPTPMDTLFQVMRDEPLPPRKRQPRVPRDLETICLMCLRKEPARRYTSAEALAGDLRRFLMLKPVIARPMPAWERGLRWVRRHVALASVLGVLLAVLLGSSVGMTHLWLQVREAQTREANLRSILDGLDPQQISDVRDFTNFVKARPELAQLTLREAAQLFKQEYPDKKIIDVVVDIFGDTTGAPEGVGETSAMLGR